MATFSETDYQALISILGLQIDQMESNSELRWKAEEIEKTDARLSTDFVGEVQRAIADYQQAENDYNVSYETDADTSIQSASVSGQFSVSYRGGGGGGYSNKYGHLVAAKNRHRATIVRLLNWTRTNPYSGSVSKGIS